MVINRIKEFIDHKGLKVSRVEKAIGASDGTLRNAIKNQTEINSKWLVLLSEIYEDLNIEWLITGNGVMFAENSKTSLDGYSVEEIITYLFSNKEAFRKNAVYQLLMENELKEKVIETLEKEKENLLKLKKTKN